MGEKMKPYIGEDGRSYYNYGVGAKYVFRENGKEYEFAITDCRMKNTTEYYKCTHNGEPYWNEFSANRIHYLLHLNLYETLSEGKRKELPLTVDEVTTYYRRKMQERSDTLKSLGNTDYSAKSKELQKIDIEKAIAEGRGQEQTVAELTAREKELRAKQAAILKAKKIDPAILRGVQFCDKCDGTGVNGLRVCDCAKKLAKEIKEYNAILRRIARARVNN